MVTDTGWRRVGPDPALAAWAAAALPRATKAVQASRDDWRCGGTWFVGLDALDNAADGSIGGVPLPWHVLGLPPVPLHPAQISVVRPGYPRQGDEETASAFGYRLRRDAAHLDGVLPIGPMRRRMVKEPHAWILGLPLNTCGEGASPLTVWEGSHAVMRAALIAALGPHAPGHWGDIDITDAYVAARKQVFESCRRIEVPTVPGEAVLLHRLIIHGVAPWGDGAEAPVPGRMIAYFRPVFRAVSEWLLAP